RTTSAARRCRSRYNLAITAVRPDNGGHIVCHFGEVVEGVVPEVGGVKLIPRLKIMDSTTADEWVFGSGDVSAVPLHECRHPLFPDAVSRGTGLAGERRHAGFVAGIDVVGRGQRGA